MNNRLQQKIRFYRERYQQHQQRLHNQNQNQHNQQHKNEMNEEEINNNRKIINKEDIFKKLEDVNEMNEIIKENIRECARRESQYYNPNKIEFRYPSCQVLFKIRENRLIEIRHTIEDVHLRERIDDIRNYIEKMLMDSTYRIHGDFMFNLHDKSDYHHDTNEIVFSKNKNTEKTLMIDLYAMQNYIHVRDVKDEKTFKNKIKKGIFIGASTGNMEIMKNDRLQFCDYSYRNRLTSNFECYMNIICQIKESDLERELPNYIYFYKPNNMSIPEQRNYRYIINIDGNTTCWDRLIWIYQGESILLKKKSDNINWYYSLMEKGNHYVEFDNCEELELKINVLNRLYDKNPDKINKIIENQKNFVYSYLTPKAHLLYMCYLFQYISEKFIN